MFSLLLPIIYLTFISLGLPDSMLGASWPSMQPAFGVPVSYVGIVFFIICCCTTISSLLSDRLTRRFGGGTVTAVSVLVSALALLGFSVSSSFWMICLLALPYGLGAGSIDAAINNYVALHYASRHMSWLHCMWGVGSTVGPMIMGHALTSGRGWTMGYRYVGLIQLVIAFVVIMSLPLWKKRIGDEEREDESPAEAMSMARIVRLPGAKEVFISFFCYCALEQVAMLWGSSYLSECAGASPELAATLGSLFCIGITAGRAVSGFITYKLSDTGMIRLGHIIIGVGGLIMLLPLPLCKMAGLVLVGLGCAPVYPCIIHSTPAHFGADKSQAVIGMQMASAYVGCTLMPPFFGLIAQHISISLMPLMIIALLALEFVMYEKVVKKCG